MTEKSNDPPLENNNDNDNQNNDNNNNEKNNIIDQETDDKKLENKNVSNMDLNEIYKHIQSKIGDKSLKEMFKSFWDKINIERNNYKQEIDKLKNDVIKCSSHKSKKAEIPKVIIPKIDVEKLINENKNNLVTSFDCIQGISPKCKLFVEFYPTFLTFIAPTKQNKNSQKTVIYYCDIERIISVPTKNEEILLFCQLKRPHQLEWRGNGKQKIGTFFIQEIYSLAFGKYHYKIILI